MRIGIGEENDKLEIIPETPFETEFLERWSYDMFLKASRQYSDEGELTHIQVEVIQEKPDWA